MGSALFSVGIVSYNNYKYIHEALESVFSQTYSQIELLISNDGSPDFNENELRDYIEKRKKKNIVSVWINNNADNLGTVKNVNLILHHATGDYIMYIAADDALYDNNVLIRYANCFEKLGDSALVLSSRTAMCSHSLKDIVNYAPDEEGVAAIKNSTEKEMFSRLTHTFTIPTTSTCYRKNVYDIMGDYDEEYNLIEDAPFFLKLYRSGYKVYWINDMTGARHRDGGISHGNAMNLSESFKKYRIDEMKFYEKEVLPYKNLILPRDRKKMLEKWKWLQGRYDQDYIRPFLSRKELLLRWLKHSPFIIWHLFQHLLIKIEVFFLNKDVRSAFLILAVSCFGEPFLVRIANEFGIVTPNCITLLGDQAFTLGIKFGCLYLISQIMKIISVLINLIKFYIVENFNK